MKKQLWGFLALLVGVCFFACRKHDISNTSKPITPASEKEIAAIKQWLSIQKNSTSTKEIDKVVDALDWSSTDKTSYKTTSTLIAVKLNTKAIAGKVAKYIVGANEHTTDYLVILMDNVGNIQQGTIGQVTPNESQDNSPPSELITHILNKSSTQFNGAFTMLTLTNVFLYQFQYENNKRAKELVLRNANQEQQIKIKADAVKGANIKTIFNEVKKDDDQVCWTWYLWIFDDYGVIWDVIYLGVECDTPCALASIRNDGELGVVRVNCIDNSSGGGSGPINLEELCNASSAQAQAVLAASQFTTPTEGFSVEWGAEYDPGDQNNPDAIEKTATPLLPVKKLFLSPVFWGQWSAFFSGVVRKEYTGDSWRWSSLGLAVIGKEWGVVPPCYTVSMTGTAAVAYAADKKQASVAVTFSGSVNITCLGGYERKNIPPTIKSGTLPAIPD